MIDALFVDELVILAITALMHSVIAVMNFSTLHRSAPKRFLCQEHHTTKTGLVQGNDTPTPKGTDHAQPTMGTGIGDISINHNHAVIPTATETIAVSEGTHCTPHPAAAVAYPALWSMDALLPFVL